MSEHDWDGGDVSFARVVLYAIAVLALVGALFYGMSTATEHERQIAKTDCR